MKIKKEDMSAAIDVPGAIARVRQDFGEASGYSTIAGEYFSLGAGTEIAPLLAGLPGDSCHAPHWGYMLEGQVTMTYVDGIYWPPGHTLRVGRDAEVILFSPAKEHNDVIDHMKTQMGG